MNEHYERFAQLMDDLAAEIGAPLAAGNDGTRWTVPLFGGQVSVNVSYRTATGQVVAFALVEPLQPSVCAEARARTLLEMTAYGAETNGFTLGLDPETHDLIACGRRGAARFADPSALADWIGDLAELVQDLRAALTEMDDVAEAVAETEEAAS